MNRIIKKIGIVTLSLVVAISLSGAVSVVRAATLTQTQIDAIVTLLESFGADLSTISNVRSALSGVPVTPVTGTGVAVSCSFTRNLYPEMSGADVKCLQQYLNAAGHQVAPSGVGSAGSETEYYGSLTTAAVKSWQDAQALAYGNWGGYFGPASRTKYDALVAAGDGVVIIPGTAYLNVTMVGPAAVIVPDGSLYNNVLKLSFMAGANEETVTGITFSRGGFIANTYVTGVSVWDEDGNRHGNIIEALTADGNATISFGSSPLVIPAGHTKYLTLAINISGDANSGTVSFSVASASDISVASGSSQPAGTFPLSGNIMTIVDGSTSLADLRVDDTSVAGLVYSTISSATGNLEIGDADREVFKLRLMQNNSKEGVQVEKVILYVQGTIQEAKDVTNWRLYSPSGDLLASTAKPVDRFVTFNLATPYVIDKGLTKDLSVKADIADGSGNYFRVYVQNNYDVVATGVTTGASVQPVDSSGNALTGADTQNANGGFKMKAGTLTASKTSDSPSGNVAPSAQNIVLAKFDLKSAGEKLEIQKMGVQVKYASAGVALTGTLSVKDASTGETYLSLSADTTGLQTTSTVTTSTLLTYQRNLSSYITILSGQTRSLEITGTVASTATSTSNYQVYVGYFYTKRYSTVDYTDLTIAAHESNQLSVTDVTLSVTKNQAFADTNRAKGASNVKIAEFVFQTSSADDIRINSISLDVATSSYIQNMKVMDGTAQLGSIVGTPSATANSFTVNLTIPKSQSKVLSVYADVLSSADEDHPFIVSIADAGVSGYGVDSGKSLSSTPSGALAGQTITVKTGALVIAQDANAPISKIVVAGGSGIELNKIKFEAQNEDLTLKKITLQLTTASTTQWTAATDIAANISKVYLYDGTTLLNDGGTAVTTGDVVIAGLDLTLVQDIPKVLTVKANISGSGTLTSKSVGGIKVKSSSTTDIEVYSSQGWMSTGITLTSNAASKNFLFHDAAPTIVNAYTASTEKTGQATDVIGKFTITNSGVRTMTITTTTITAILGGTLNTTSTVSNFRFYDESDVEIASATGFISATSTSGTFAFGSFSSTQEIGAGASKTYTVKADTSNIRTGTITSGIDPNLFTKIDGTKGYLSTDLEAPDELLWNDGDVVYSYTPVNGSELSSNSASDSVPVDGPTLSY